MEEARRQTDQLLQVVNADSLYERPNRERHRIIFYLGDLDAFDWNLLQPRDWPSGANRATNNGPCRTGNGK